MKKIITFVLVMIVVFVTVTTIYRRQMIKNSIMETSSELKKEFSIETKENNIVLVKFYNESGIQEIKYPSGDIISCYGKNDVVIDYEVDENQKYEFVLKDINNIEKNYEFITPSVHIELTKNDIDVELASAKDNIINNLNENLIATNFINIGVGEKGYVDSDTTDMEEIFNSWTSFGSGTWKYNATTKVLTNSKNTNDITGYYNPTGDYTDISLKFSAMTTDTDDDILGAMVRFNNMSNGKYSSYLFLLDRHDTNGKGVNNGAYNGISKISNNPIALTSVNKLAINSSLRWKRKTWQEYKLTANGKKLELYIDGELVIQTEDDSISKGSYGFLTYSQPASFKDVTVETNKEYTLTEIINKADWERGSVNIIINLNNQKEDVLLTQDCIDSFNNDNIHYLAVTSSDNESDVNTFLSKIDSRGKYIESTDYDTYINNINNYLVSYMKE